VRLEENAAAADIALEPADIARLEAVVNSDGVRGDRHWDMASIDR
jgi:hypothetical protein